eukprot:12942671-Alexandrium_andersonii.AAC.1
MASSPDPEAEVQTGGRLCSALPPPLAWTLSVSFVQVVAVRYEANRERGVWCFVEPTPDRRDRLIEAFVVLSAISG